MVESITNKIKLFDVAANLSSIQYQGVYKGKKVHTPDVDQVIFRAQKLGCNHMLVAASNLKDIDYCYNIVKNRLNFYMTVGVHPAKTKEIYQIKDYLTQMENKLEKYQDKVVAVGECGLDYDRLFCSQKETQLEAFEMHFKLAEKYDLPMYFHSRNATKDFVYIIDQNRSKFKNGIVHCFTGNNEELQEFIKRDLYFSIGGLAFKESKNFDIIRNIPINKLMLETDAPYCQVLPRMDGYQYIDTKIEYSEQRNYNVNLNKIVKGRNEPCTMVQILEISSKILKMDKQQLADICFQNSLKFFNVQE